MSHTIQRHGLMAAALLAFTALSNPALAGTLTGSVIDAAGIRGLTGTEVEIVELGRSTTAGQDGSYRFIDLPAGTYTLRAIYAGADESSTRVTVGEDGVTRANIVLRAGDADGVLVGARAGNDDTILVIGQQANLGSSISRQRAADVVATILTRDAVGQFPDQNVAEALRRAPGINVLNDQGEGRFVSVRGLDPNLNSTSINGNRVLATGGDERAAALDVIPSELVESIEIKKTLTPDMDGDTLGGSIEINTTSAFDRKQGFLSVKAEGSYNDLRDAVSPKLGVDFSTRLNEDFGISGGASYHNRKFSSDNIEMDGWSEADNGQIYAEDLEYRDYDVTRERIGASLSFDARASDTTSLYLRGLYSRFDDHEYRRRLVFGFDGEPSGGTDTAATFDSADDEISVERDLKDRREIQTIKTISLGGKTETGPWRVTYDASWSEARQFEDGSIDPVVYARGFEDPSALGVTIDTSRLGRPGYTVNYGSAAFSDPAGYGIDKLERTTDENARDREYAFRADVAREFALDNGTFEIQAGGKARFRKKQLDMSYDIFDDFDGDFTLADVVGRQSYGLATIDPVPGPGQWRDFYRGNGTAGMIRNGLESDWVSAAEDYRAKEDILAGYLLGRFDNSVLRVIGGVRVERTRNNFTANRLEVNEDEETLAITPVNYKRSYTDWLPSLNVRYAPARDVVLRAGVFKSLMRPKLSNIAPRFVIEENDEGEREGEFGNPDLKPYRAWNFDVAAEYYFARNAVVQGGVFYKKIKDFIVDVEFGEDDAPYNGVYNGIAFTEAEIPLNGDKATVKGFEFAYQQAFDFLPGALSGLLTNINYTYTDAKGRLADGTDLAGRRIALPSSSKHTINAMLGYEKGPVSLRLSATHRSGYLDEVGGGADEDRYVRKHIQVDFTAKYQVTKAFQLVAEAVNIFDEPYTAYANYGGSRRLLQYEEYGPTIKFGARASF